MDWIGLNGTYQPLECRDIATRPASVNGIETAGPFRSVDRLQRSRWLRIEASPQRQRQADAIEVTKTVQFDEFTFGSQLIVLEV